MTKDEALKLALHGLEMGVTLIEDFGSKEQLNTQHKAIAAIYEALAQPEQEPVAWLCRRKTGGSLFVYTEEQLHELGYGNISVPPFDKVSPLYTTPPQRTWVGLTPDELNAIFDGMKTWSSFQITDVYFAIEAKLKEKNT